MDSKLKNRFHSHLPAASSFAFSTSNSIQNSVLNSELNSVLNPGPNPAKNQKGQGLVEYLIIVALMGVATITVMRTMQGTVSNRFAHIAATLQGKTTDFSEPDLRKDLSKQKDMGSFFKNADMKSDSSAGNDSN